MTAALSTPTPAPHPSAYAQPITFGKHRDTGATLGSLCTSPEGRAYLTWLAGCREFFDSYWPEAAAKALSGDPVPPHPAMRSAKKPVSQAGRGSAAAWPAPTSYTGTTPSAVGITAATIETLDSGLLAVRFPRNATLEAAFKAGVDGRYWNRELRCWEIPAVQVRRAVEVLGGAEAVIFDQRAKALYDAEVARRVKLDVIRRAMTGTLHIDGLRIPLYPYQVVAVEFFVASGGRAIFAHEVGLGKTPMAIACALHLKAKTLVLCPAAVKIGWERKIAKFAGLPATSWEGDRVRGDLDHQFHLVTYEIFVKRKAELQAQGFQLLVIDECHNFSNPKAQRTLAVFGGSEKKKDKRTGRTTRVKHERFTTEWCVMLTATAVNNAPRELFPLVNYLAPDRFPNFYEYGMRYGAFPAGNLSGLPSKPMNLSDLHTRIGDLVLRDVDRSDRPKKVVDDLWVELTPAQRREYRRLLDDLMGEWAEAGKPTLAAMHVLREWLNCIKLPLVWETMDALLAEGKSVVLFSTRLEPLKRTVERYGTRAVLIEGRQTLKKRQQHIDAFEARVVPVAAISIRAGGTGIDGLQHASHHCIMLDQDWVPALHHQAEGRLDRTGQTERVFVWYAMVKDTVDEYLREIIERKLAIASEIMDGKVQKLVRRKSVFREFVQRLKKDYAGLVMQDADEAEGAADEHLEEAA